MHYCIAKLKNTDFSDLSAQPTYAPHRGRHRNISLSPVFLSMFESPGLRNTLFLTIFAVWKTIQK